jgi:hypothetical protein
LFELPEFASLLGLSLPEGWLGGGWKAFHPPPDAALRFLADAAFFFFLRNARAILSSLRMAGETCNVEMTFINPKSSYFIMVLGQGLTEKSSCKSA